MSFGRVGKKMGKLEGLQKELDGVDRTIRYIQNIILALSTGIVWSIYAYMEKKVDSKIIILLSIGVVALVWFFLFWIKESKREKELIEKIYMEEN